VRKQEIKSLKKAMEEVTPATNRVFFGMARSKLLKTMVHMHWAKDFDCIDEAPTLDDLKTPKFLARRPNKLVFANSSLPAQKPARRRHPQESLSLKRLGLHGGNKPFSSLNYLSYLESMESHFPMWFASAKLQILK
jgi:hypothetical protein